MATGSEEDKKAAQGVKNKAYEAAKETYDNAVTAAETTAAGELKGEAEKALKDLYDAEKDLSDAKKAVKDFENEGKPTSSIQDEVKNAQFEVLKECLLNTKRLRSTKKSRNYWIS